jgi:hypothetical protein
MGAKVALTHAADAQTDKCVEQAFQMIMAFACKSSKLIELLAQDMQMPLCISIFHHSQDSGQKFLHALF